MSESLKIKISTYLGRLIIVDEAYPIPSFLTPQDTDFGKSLLRFSEESEITEDGMKWLAFQVATTYGLDKATMDERLAWVSIEENRQTIIRVARDPINNIGDWENADEPWQFLAACHEYYSVVIAGKKTQDYPWQLMLHVQVYRYWLV